MSRSIEYNHDFIVGGDPSAKLSNNFRLKEFFDPRGEIRIHRELVSALQVLRDGFDASIGVAGVLPASGLGAGLEGRFIFARSGDNEALRKQADDLLKEGYFGLVEQLNDLLYLEMPPPDDLPPFKPETAFLCGLKVTAAFETSGDPFQQVTGNFDGAGLSFGPIQCNFKSGTLQEIFKRFELENPRTLQTCFADEAHYAEWMGLIRGSRSKAIAWADDNSIGRNKGGIREPWNSYLRAVGRVPGFQRVMTRYAYDKYGKLMMSAVAFLDGLTSIRIDNMICLAALYDTGVQQGSLTKAHNSIRRRVEREQPTDQFQLVRIAVEERAMKASKAYRADCMSRRLAILAREPVTVVQDGVRRTRANNRLYLLRNSKVRSVDRFLSA